MVFDSVLQVTAVATSMTIQDLRPLDITFIFPMIVSAAVADLHTCNDGLQAALTIA